MNQKLTKLIENFLAERRESDGGFAEVHKEDMDLLHKIMNTLIELKFGVDPDGDYPVNYELIDRNKYESLPFLPVPYSHTPRREKNNLRTNEEIEADEIKREEANFEITLLNLEIAMNRFSTAQKCRRFRLDERKRKVEMKEAAKKLATMFDPHDAHVGVGNDLTVYVTNTKEFCRQLTEKLPKEIGGFPVKVVHTGRIRAN